MKLKNKLILSFLFSILISIFFISLIANSMINRRFDIYLVEEQQNRLQFISDDINALYNLNGYKLYESDINSYASLENIYIEIKDLNNQIIYYSANKNGMMGMGGRMHGRMHSGMMGMRPIVEGKYTERSFPLMEDKKQVGILIIGYIDNSYLTEEALVFKDTLSKSILISAVFTILVGMLISIFLSKSLTTPLIDIRNTAIEIRKGNLGRRSKINSNTREILDLSDSINYLGESLANQEKIRRKYAQDISHELRTPLSTLKSHLEAIIDKVWEPNEEHLKILMEEIDRLSSLIDDLRDSFRAEEIELVLNKTRFNLSLELEQIVESFLPLYKKGGFSLEMDLPDNKYIYMDKDKLKQVMYNLLSNSIKYLSDNGQVMVCLTELNSQLVIEVRDNGMGIREEEIPLIFNRFYKSDNLNSHNVKGTGLGLAIVKSIVEAHGGEIQLRSKYGEGTSVAISLPANSK